ncbi:MAG: L7Ae/L30e/S12e/Gadd45 family ribosomal protein [Christensenellales bacterium]|jgi:ribosomal protein L7Ae-like RNA K-turn-binding protein
MKKVLNMLGLCARAGKLMSGERSTEQAIKKGGCFLAVIDGAISAVGKKSITDACAYRNVPFVALGENELGPAIGKSGRMAAAVTDEGFARRIAELVRETHSDTGVYTKHE